MHTPRANSPSSLIRSRSLLLSVICIKLRRSDDVSLHLEIETTCNKLPVSSGEHASKPDTKLNRHKFVTESVSIIVHELQLLIYLLVVTDIA